MRRDYNLFSFVCGMIYRLKLQNTLATLQEKQLDTLIGISRLMEKSLQSIDAKSGSNSANASQPTGNANVGGSAAALASMATSIKLITDALNVKSGSVAKSGSVILDFLSGLVSVSENVNRANLDSLSTAAESISEFVETFSNLSLMGIAKIALAGKILFGGKESTVKKIISSAVSAVEGFDKDSLENLKLAGEGITMLVNGLMKLGKALATMALVGMVAPLALLGAGVSWLVVKMFTGIGEKLKDVENGLEGIGMIGKGLVLLAAGLATMALLVTLVPVGKLVETLMLVLAISGVFMLVGKGADKLDAGAKAMKGMGIALIALAAGIAMISLVTMLVPIKNLLMGIALIAAYSLVFYLIGKMTKEIADGALTMIFGLAVGLFFFSGALLLLSYTFEKFTFEDAFLSILVIGAFAALFEIIGANTEFIGAGAESLALMGVALIAFSVGILLYALSLKAILALFKGDYLEASIGAVAILGGMGIIFGILGAIPTIAEGAIAMGIVGAALILISAGLLIFALSLKGVLALFKDDYTVAAAATSVILLGFGAIFGVLGLAAPFIELGGISMALIGASLVAFSVGLILFGLALKAIFAMGIYDEKEHTLKGINLIWDVGKQVAALSILLIPISFGTAAALMLGGSLISISLGLLLAAKAIESIPDTKSFTEKLFDSEKGIIPALSKGFAAIYNADKKGAGAMILGTLQALTGASPVQLGIKMVAGMGEILKEVAGGIAAFGDPENFPVKIPDGKGGLKWGTVNILETTEKLIETLVGDGVIGPGNKGILLALANAFGQIGATYPTNFWGDSAVSTGIESVKGIGQILADLAGGIAAFSDPEKFPIQMPNDRGEMKWTTVQLSAVIPKIIDALLGDGIDSNRPGILFALANAFAQIGIAYPNGGFLGLGDSPVTKGVNAVKGIAEVVANLASGITAFASMNKFPLTYDKDGKPTSYGPLDLAKVVTNIQTVLTSLPSAFATLDVDQFEDAEEKAEAALELTKTFKGIAENFVKISTSYAKMKPVEAKDLGTDAISAFSNSMTTFINSINTASLKSDSLASFEQLADIFDSLADSGSGFTKFVDAFIKLQDPLIKFANTMDKIGNNIKNISGNISKYVLFINATNALANNNPQLTKLQSPFEKVSNDMGVLVDNVSRLNVKSLTNFESLIADLKKMIDIDLAKLKETAEAAKKIADATIIGSSSNRGGSGGGGGKSGSGAGASLSGDSLLTMKTFIAKADELITSMSTMIRSANSDATAAGQLKNKLEELIQKLPV